MSIFSKDPMDEAGWGTVITSDTDPAPTFPYGWKVFKQNIESPIPKMTTHRVVWIAYDPARFTWSGAVQSEVCVWRGLYIAPRLP